LVRKLFNIFQFFDFLKSFLRCVCGRALSCWSNSHFRFPSAGYFLSKTVYIFSNCWEYTSVLIVEPSGTSS
jgi:hypothetical protein